MKTLREKIESRLESAREMLGCVWDNNKMSEDDKIREYYKLTVEKDCFNQTLQWLEEEESLSKQSPANVIAGRTITNINFLNSDLDIDGFRVEGKTWHYIESMMLNFDILEEVMVRTGPEGVMILTREFIMELSKWFSDRGF